MPKPLSLLALAAALLLWGSSAHAQSGATEFEAGRLGTKEISGDQILLGDILLFTEENIDQFDL